MTSSRSHREGTLGELLLLLLLKLLFETTGLRVPAVVFQGTGQALPRRFSFAMPPVGRGQAAMGRRRFSAEVQGLLVMLDGPIITPPGVVGQGGLPMDFGALRGQAATNGEGRHRLLEIAQAARADAPLEMA